jgi:hypothetical protein
MDTVQKVKTACSTQSVKFILQFFAHAILFSILILITDESQQESMWNLLTDHKPIYIKKKLCGLSLQANYTLPTDRRCRRS